VTRYELFRRRIAPVAFVCAIGLVAYDAWNKHDRASATFVLDLGAAERDVKAVDAEVWVDGERLATFHRVALDGMTIGTPQFRQGLPGRDGELRVEVERASGHTRIVRPFHADDDATVRLPLASDLR
jgi:hypothetical protein